MVEEGDPALVEVEETGADVQVLAEEEVTGVVGQVLAVVVAETGVADLVLVVEEVAVAVAEEEEVAEAAEEEEVSQDTVKSVQNTVYKSGGLSFVYTILLYAVKFV